MLASEFDFDLPQRLIAQQPLERRGQSRLMVVDRRASRFSHRRFDELPDLLVSGDLLVRNDTRVIPARLVGRREQTNGRWEGLFLADLGDGSWEILARTRGRPRPGEIVIVGDGLRLRLEAQGENGHWTVRPQIDQAEQLRTLELLDRHGAVPLPPYIRKGEAVDEDRAWYQTVYAQRPGSVAAPTAGLHFSESLFERLAERGVRWTDLTLQVGVGTFRPITAPEISDHVMHSEWVELSAQSAEALNAQRRSGGRIVAVGTTSARVLETVARDTAAIQPFSGPTNLFIRPGHVFHGVDALITNFHLPRSSLLVLVSALAGVDLIRAGYQEAIRQEYRFFSYGDAMLIV